MLQGKIGGISATKVAATLGLAAIAALAVGAVETEAGRNIAYYRFENGTAGDFSKKIDDSKGGQATQGRMFNGRFQFVAAPPINPVPKTGESNTLAGFFRVKDAAKFTYPFPFHAHANATLELWVFPTDPKEDSPEVTLFWTTTSPGDANRFNIGLGPRAAGARPIFVEYRDPTGELHLGGTVSSVPCPILEWSFVAIVKDGDTYSIYINNSLTEFKTQLTATAVDASPDLPTSPEWTINGREFIQPAGTRFQFDGLLDEIRLSSDALRPAQFLVKA